MGVLALVEVDLGDRVEPGDGIRVDQQADVDAVSGRERQPLEQLAPGGDLAGQRLLHRGQVGIEQVEQRAGGQLGHAAAAVGNRRLAEAKRPPVEALDERDPRPAQHGPEHATGEMGAEPLGVGVEEADHVSGQDAAAPATSRRPCRAPAPSSGIRAS